MPDEAETATISIVFVDLSGAEPDEAVSPALPRILRLLAERDLPASFVLPPDLAAAEPFALTLIENARHTVLGSAPTGDAYARAGSSPAEWHVAMQQAIGAATSSRGHTTLAFDLAAVERADSASLLAETLDLIAGLRRAESVKVVSFDA
ncbi:MAG: hypothetical protein ACPGWS_03100 [Solirubrobacterales bacterium]